MYGSAYKAMMSFFIVVLVHYDKKVMIILQLPVDSLRPLILFIRPTAKTTLNYPNVISVKM